MTVEASAALSPADATAELVRVLQQCVANQPALGLLDSAAEVRVLGVEDGRIRVALGDIVGSVDLAQESFEPDQPAQVQGAVIERLQAEHGDTEFRAGRREVRVDWEDLTILGEEDGVIRAAARPVDQDVPVLLTITSDLGVEVEPAFEPPPAGPAAEAGLAAALVEAIGSEPAAAAAIARLAATRPAGGDARRSLVSEVLSTAFVPTGGAS